MVYCQFAIRANHRTNQFLRSNKYRILEVHFVFLAQQQPQHLRWSSRNLPPTFPPKKILFRRRRQTKFLFHQNLSLVSTLKKLTKIRRKRYSSLVFPIRVNGLLPFRIHENVRLKEPYASPPHLFSL